MESSNIRTSILVVGAGPAGLCATRAFLDACFSVVCIDEQDCVGGSYCHHSQRHGESAAFVFSDPTFLAPLPDPNEPADVQRYLASYASYFNIDEHLRLACRLDRLAFNTREGLWRATVYDKASGQCWEATADHVVLCVGHPRRCTLNEAVGSQEAVHACCVTPQELLLNGLPVTVVGDGLPAMDTAQAVSLLLGGDRVRLQLAQHLPAGPVSVHMQQQQQQAPVHGAGPSTTAAADIAAAAGEYTTTTTTTTTTAVHIPGTQLLPEARRRTLSASLRPHYTLPPPGLLARAVRAPAKRRFWAQVKGKATALLRPPLRPTRNAVAAGPTRPSDAPASSSTSGRRQHSAQEWAQQQQQGGEQEQQQLVLYAPSLADPRYLPFLDPELRRALLGAAAHLTSAEPGGAAAGGGGGGGRAGCLPAGCCVALYRGMMHPELPGLAFVGWQAAPSANRPLLLQLQAQWLAAHLAGRVLLPLPEDMRADAAAQAAWHASCLASHLASPGASLARSHEENYMNQLLGDLHGIVKLQPAASTRAISVPVPHTPARSHEPAVGAHPGESSVPFASSRARGIAPADGSTSARLLLRCFGREQVHCQPAEADPADPWVTPSAHQLPYHAAQHAGGPQPGPLTPAVSCPLPSLSRQYTSPNLPDALAGPPGASWQQQQQHQGPGQRRQLQPHRPTEISEPLPVSAVRSSSGAVGGPEDSLAADAATTFALGMGLGVGTRRPAPTPPRTTLTSRLSYSGFSNNSGLLRRISTNILSLSRSLSRPGGKQPPFSGSQSSSASATSLPRFGASLRRSLTGGAPLTPEQSTTAAPRAPMRTFTSTSYRTGNSTSGVPSVTSPSPPRSSRVRRSLSMAGGGRPSSAGLRSPERLVLCVTSPTVAPHMSAKLRALDERYGGSGAVAAEDAGEATMTPPAAGAAGAGLQAGEQLQRRGVEQQQSLRRHMTFSAYDEPSDGRDPRSLLPGPAQQPSLQRPLASEFQTPEGPALTSGHHSHSPPHSPMITSAYNNFTNAGGEWEGPSASNFTNTNTHTYSRALAQGRPSANLPVPQPLVVAAATLTPDRPAPISAQHLAGTAAPGFGGEGPGTAAAAAAAAATRPGAAAESPHQGPGRVLQAPRSWNAHAVSAGTSFRGAGFLRTLFPTAATGGRAGGGAAPEAAPGPSPPLSPTPLSPQLNAAAAAAAAAVADPVLASPPPRTPRVSLTGALSRLLNHRPSTPSSSGFEFAAAANAAKTAADTPERRCVSRARSDVLVQRYSAATRGSVPGHGPAGQSAGGRSADGRNVPVGGRGRTPRGSATGSDRPVGHFQPGSISGQLRRMSESTGIELALLVELVSDDGSSVSPYVSPELRLRQQRTQQQQHQQHQQHQHQQQGPVGSLRRQTAGAPLHPLQATQEESEEGGSSGSRSSSDSGEEGLPLSASPGPAPTLLSHVPQQLHQAGQQGASERGQQEPEQELQMEEVDGEQGEEVLLPAATSFPGPESPAPGSSPHQQLRLPALPLRLRLRQQLPDQSPLHHQPVQPPSPAGSPAAHVAAALAAACASNGFAGTAAGRQLTAGILRAAFASQMGPPGSPAAAAATHGSSPPPPPDEVLGMALRGPADPHPFLLAAEDAAEVIPVSRLEITDAGGEKVEAAVDVSGGPREVSLGTAAAVAAVGGAQQLDAAGPVVEAVATVGGTATAAAPYPPSPFTTSAMGWNGPRPAPRPTAPRVGGGSEYDMVDPWGVVAKWLAEASKPEEAGVQQQQQQQQEQEDGYHRQGLEGGVRLELALGVAEQLQGVPPMLVGGGGGSGSGVRVTGAGTAGGGGQQQEEERQQEWQPGMALGSLRVGPELDGGADVSAAEAAGDGVTTLGCHVGRPVALDGAGANDEGDDGLCGEFVLRTSNARVVLASEATAGGDAGCGGGGGGSGERRTPQPPPGWLSRATSGQAGAGGGPAVLSPLGTPTHGSAAAPERVAVGPERGEPAAMSRGQSVPAGALSGPTAAAAAAGAAAGAGFHEASCEQALCQSNQRSSFAAAAFGVPAHKGGFSLDGTCYSGQCGGGGGGGGCGDGSSGNRTGDSNPSKRSNVKGFFGLASLFARKSYGSANSGPEQPHKHPQLQHVQDLLQQQQQRRRRQSCRSSFDRSSMSMLDAAAMAAAVPYSDMFRRTSNGTTGPMTHGSQELGHGSSAFGRAKDGSSGSASGLGAPIGGRVTAVTSHGSGVASHAKAMGSSAAAAVTATTLAVASPAPGEAPGDTSVVEGCLDMDLVLTLRQSYTATAEGAGEGTRGSATRVSRQFVRRRRSNSGGRCDAVGEEGEEAEDEDEALQGLLFGTGQPRRKDEQQQQQPQRAAPVVPAMRADPAQRVSGTGAAPYAVDPTISPFTCTATGMPSPPQHQQQQQQEPPSGTEPLLSFPPVQQQQLRLRLHQQQDQPRPELAQQTAPQGEGRTSPVSPFSSHLQPRPSLQLQLRQLAGISNTTIATATTAGVTLSSWSPLSKLARSGTWLSDGLPSAPAKSYGSEVFPGGGGGVSAAAGGSGGAPRSPGSYATAGSNMCVTPRRSTAQTGAMLTGTTLRFMRSEGPRRSATMQLSDDPADLASCLLGSPTITTTPSPASLSARAPGRISMGVGPTPSSLLLHHSRSNTPQSPFHPSARSSPRAVPSGRSIDLNAELLRAAQWSVAQREQRELYGPGGGGAAGGSGSRLQVTKSEVVEQVPSSSSGGLDVRPRMSYHGGGVTGGAAQMSVSWNAAAGGMAGVVAGRGTTDSISEEQPVDALPRGHSEVWEASQGQGRDAARTERRGPAWAVRQASQARQDQLVNQVSTWLKQALEAKAAGQPPPPLPASDKLLTANALAHDRTNRPTVDERMTGEGGSAAAWADGARGLGSAAEEDLLAPEVGDWRS